MLAFLTITSMLILLQAQESAAIRASGRLIEVQREAMDQRSLHAMLTADVAEAMIGQDRTTIPLNGTPFEREIDGRVWRISVQDIEGLIDIYLAPPELLRSAGLPEARILTARERLSTEARFGRLPSLAQTAAYMGIPTEQWPLLTQSARSPGLRAETAPDGLSKAGRHQSAQLKVFGQTNSVSIDTQRQR